MLSGSVVTAVTYSLAAIGEVNLQRVLNRHEFPEGVILDVRSCALCYFAIK
jgi:hypothetical protein